MTLILKLDKALDRTSDEEPPVALSKASFPFFDGRRTEFIPLAIGRRGEVFTDASGSYQFMVKDGFEYAIALQERDANGAHIFLHRMSEPLSGASREIPDLDIAASRAH